MDDRSMLAVALLFSLLGTALLWYSAASIQPEQSTIGEIGSGDIGKPVVVEGTISDVGYSSKGSVFLELSDGKAKIDVPLFPDVAGEIEKNALKKGARLRISGTVGEYKGDLQVVPSRAENLVFLEGIAREGDSGFTSISMIDETLLGREVRIRGQVTDIFYHEKGHIFLDISDETGTIDVPLFSELGVEGVSIGSQVEIYGRVDVYKGAMEVVPESGEDVMISPLELLNAKINELGTDDLNRIIILEGDVLEVSRHSKGHFFVEIGDGTGEISVAIFSNTAEKEEIWEIEKGSPIRVVGKVDIYKGELEIIAFEVELDGGGGLRSQVPSGPGLQKENSS